ncbi:MAG: hypothetical protein RSE41_01295, partial [Clostridia bacterium]
NYLYNSFYGYINGVNAGVNNKFNTEGSAVTDIEVDTDIVISFVLDAINSQNQIFINGQLKSFNSIQEGTGDYINNTMSIGNAKNVYNNLNNSYEYGTGGKFELKKIYFYNNLLTNNENDQIYQAIATIPLEPYEKYLALNVNEVPSTPSSIIYDVKADTNTIGVFKNCSGLMHDFNIKNFDKFFQGLIKTKSLSSFFEGCNNIQGYIPEKLLNNLSYLVNCDNMFKNCTSITPYITDDETPIYYFVHPMLFKYNNNIESLVGFFSGWNFTSFHNSIIPEELFYNLSKLRDVSYMFYKTYLPKGIPESLFAKNHNLANISYIAAESDYNSNMLSSRLFLPYSLSDKIEIGNKLTSANYAFSKCINISGEPIPFWSTDFYELLKNNYNKCYQDCNKLTGYSTFPSIAK